MFGLSDDEKELISRLAVPVPKNESERLKVLREAQLLDSLPEECFDRITAMGQRMFKVPIALVSLVDVDRQWFKANCGLPDASQTHRNEAFCSYTVMPNSPDVLVVPDASLDPRFASNPLVTGPPYIRFYAGAALVVAGVRLGSLCMIDTVPRTFDLEDNMNLLDLGEIVSSMIRQRRDNILNMHQERSRLMLEMMHGVRTPLMSLDCSLSLLKQQVRPALDTATDTTAANSNNEAVSTIDDMEYSISRLKVAVESCVVLGLANAAGGQSSSSSSSGEAGKVRSASSSTAAHQCPFRGCRGTVCSKTASKETLDGLVECDVMACVRRLQSSTSSLLHGSASWSIDQAQSLVNKRHFTSPDMLQLVVLSTMQELIGLDCTVNFSVSFVRNNVNTPTTSSMSASVSSSTLSIATTATDILDVDRLQTSESCELGFIVISILSEVSAQYRSKYLQVIVDVRGRLEALRDQVEALGGSCQLPTASTVTVCTSTGSSCALYSFEIPYRLQPVLPTTECVVIQTSEDSSSKLLVPSPLVPIPGKSADGDPSISSACVSSRPATDTPRDINSGDTISRPTATCRQPRVLIVEDSMPIQKMLKKWLDARGCVVSVACNGKVGVALLQESEKDGAPFDLVLMDFLMPVMSGIECLQTWTKWRDTHVSSLSAGPLVVGMSATACEAEHDQAFQYGMHVFSAKPLHLGFLGMCLQVIGEKLAGGGSGSGAGGGGGAGGGVGVGGGGGGGGGVGVGWVVGQVQTRSSEFSQVKFSPTSFSRSHSKVSIRPLSSSGLSPINASSPMTPGKPARDKDRDREGDGIRFKVSSLFASNRVQPVGN